MSGAKPPLPPHRIGRRRRGRWMAERGPGIGRRARRSPGRPGGATQRSAAQRLRAARKSQAGCAELSRAAPRVGLGEGGSDNGGGSASGAPRWGRSTPGREGERSRGRGRRPGRGGAADRVVGVLWQIRGCDGGSGWWWEFSSEWGEVGRVVSERALSPLRGGRGKRRQPRCSRGSGAERWWPRIFRGVPRGRRPAPRSPVEAPRSGSPARGSTLYLIHAFSSIIHAALTPALSGLPFTPAHLSPSPSRRVSRATCRRREGAAPIVWVSPTETLNWKTCLSVV